MGEKANAKDVESMPSIEKSLSQNGKFSNNLKCQLQEQKSEMPAAGTKPTDLTTSTVSRREEYTLLT